MLEVIILSKLDHDKNWDPQDPFESAYLEQNLNRYRFNKKQFSQTKEKESNERQLIHEKDVGKKLKAKSSSSKDPIPAIKYENEFVQQALDLKAPIAEAIKNMAKLINFLKDLKAKAVASGSNHLSFWCGFFFEFAQTVILYWYLILHWLLQTKTMKLKTSWLQW